MPLLVIEHAEEKPIDNLSSFVVAAPAALSLMCDEDVRDHLPLKYDAPLVQCCPLGFPWLFGVPFAFLNARWESCRRRGRATN